MRVPFNEKDKFLSNMPVTLGFSVPNTISKKIDIINKKNTMRKIISTSKGNSYDQRQQ
jgi:hypothetical protein